MAFRGCQVYFLIVQKGLENYEILACEPLHDIENHIKNVFEEIPHHMADKKKVTDFIGAVFNGNEVLIIVLV